MIKIPSRVPGTHHSKPIGVTGIGFEWWVPGTARIAMSLVKKLGNS
jgi:hypothetical protein